MCVPLTCVGARTADTVVKEGQEDARRASMSRSCEAQKFVGRSPEKRAFCMDSLMKLN